MIPLAVSAWGTALTLIACWGPVGSDVSLSSGCMHTADLVQMCEAQAAVTRGDAMQVFGQCLELGR